MRRRGFTLIELMVVLAMIALLMTAFGVSVTSANRRARIARATEEVREMTNAILAYEQWAKNRSLDGCARPAWTDCSETEMKMILGGETGYNGDTVPVLYGGAIDRGMIRDPWGKPYQYRIEKTGTLSAGQGSGGDSAKFVTAPIVPNMWRLSKDERGLRKKGGGR